MYTKEEREGVLWEFHRSGMSVPEACRRLPLFPTRHNLYLWLKMEEAGELAATEMPDRPGRMHCAHGEGSPRYAARARRGREGAGVAAEPEQTDWRDWGADLPEDPAERARMAEARLAEAPAASGVLKAPGPASSTGMEKWRAGELARERSPLVRLGGVTETPSIPKSTYPGRAARASGPDPKAALRVRVRASFEASGGAYGAESVTADLRSGEGEPVSWRDPGSGGMPAPVVASEKVVRAIMAEEGLVSRKAAQMARRARHPGYAGELPGRPANLPLAEDGTHDSRAPEPIVSLDKESLKADLRELVRRTVGGTPNDLIKEEAGDLADAERHGRTVDRKAYRAGHYERKLMTTSGEGAIRMPKPKGMRFTTAIIERHHRHEESIEEAIIEMYPAGVSTRHIEDVSEILWGSSVSAATVSNLNERAFGAVEARRNRSLERAYPCVCVDGICLKRSWGGSYEDVAAMVAIGISDDGCREVIGAAEGLAESAECWHEFLSWLKSRGLHGVRMLAGDKAVGMAGPVAAVFPRAAHQRCAAHSYRNALARVPKSKGPKATTMLKGIHAMKSREASEVKAPQVAEQLGATKLGEATRVVREGHAKTLTYARCPREHWRRIRTDNAIECLNREIRRCTRVVGTFPDGKNALMLVTARLKYVTEGEWGSRRYLGVTLLEG